MAAARPFTALADDRLKSCWNVVFGRADAQVCVVAISIARRRALSDRPPCASACILKTVRRSRKRLWCDRFSSPITSACFCFSWPTIIWRIASISFRTVVSKVFSFLWTVNLVSMALQTNSLRRPAPPLFALLHSPSLRGKSWVAVRRSPRVRNSW